MTSTNNARPSLLAEDRDALKQPERVAEKLSLVAFKWLNPLIPTNYRASNVAQSIVSTLQTAGAGQHVLLPGDMQTQAHEIDHRRVQDAELHRAFLVGKSEAIRRLQ